MCAYKSGSLAYRDVKIALKTYKSHQKPPDLEAIEQKYKPYKKKKEMLQKQVLDKLNTTSRRSKDERWD